MLIFNRSHSLIPVLKYQPNARSINISDGEKVSDYEMKLMDLDTEHLGIPVSIEKRVVQVRLFMISILASGM